jgi:uncharacterized membrane protein YdjX (TVP38/TMEM64 family)
MSEIKKSLFLWLYFTIVVVVFFLFLYFVDDWSSLPDRILFYRDEIKLSLEANLIAGILVYIILFSSVVALALPLTAILVILSGYLFGYVGLAIAIFCMLVGSSITFYAVSKTTNKLLEKKALDYLHKSRKMFNENQLIYLTLLRMFPLFPFSVVTAMAGFLGVKLRVFLLATCIGSFPSCFAFVIFGREIDSFFKSNEQLSFSVLTSPEFLAATAIISLLFISPLFLKRRLFN